MNIGMLYTGRAFYNWFWKIVVDAQRFQGDKDGLPYIKTDVHLGYKDFVYFTRAYVGGIELRRMIKSEGQEYCNYVRLWREDEMDMPPIFKPVLNVLLVKYGFYIAGFVK